MRAFAEKYPLLLIIPCVAVASIAGINQYQYGMCNQFISIPWLQDLMEPQLYPHDFLVDQRENSPTVFLMVLKALLPVFQTLPWLFFILYSFNHLLLFFAIYKLFFSLFRDTRVAILGIVACSFAFPVLGDIHLWSTSLMERTLALPLLLLSISSQLRKNFWWAVFLQGIAFNIHPLSGFYVVIISWLAIVVAQGFKKEYLAYAVLFLVIASPVLYLKFSTPSLNPTAWQEAVWLKVMRVRNAHHAFPSAYSLEVLVKSAAIAVVFGGMVSTLKLHSYLKKYLVGFACATALLLLIGLVFTEIYPVKLILQLQFFRAYRFFIFLTLALWVGGLILQPKPLYYLLALLVLSQYFAQDLGKSAAAVVLIFLGWLWFKKTLKGSNVLYLCGLYLFLGLAAFTQRDHRAYFKGLQDPEWYNLQGWFAQNTSAESLVIVPPQQLGFRVYSQRSSYGDWYDGTKAFFSETYAAYWWEHMSKLNCTNPDSLVQDYRKNKADVFLKIAREEQKRFKNVYVIQYQESPLALPKVNEFGRFVVYRIPSFLD